MYLKKMWKPNLKCNMKLLKEYLVYCCLISLGIGCKGLSSQEEPEDKPNIIFIVADDLGYGDLSCLGQEKFNTPNIDQLASEGILFTQHYSGSTSLCTISIFTHDRTAFRSYFH